LNTFEEITVNNLEGDNRKNIHLKKGTNKKDIANLIQFTAQFGNANMANFESDRHIDSESERMKWSIPFSVDDLEDF
jgi:hypothetical protein